MTGVECASTPVISFEHLFRLSDSVGLFEHAKGTERRIEHGYCVDDVARGLLVVAREPEATEDLRRLARTYLSFVINAQTGDGRFHNRRGSGLRWEDEPSLDDCWGRALWGLGTTVARIPELAGTALAAFDRSSTRRSTSVRATAFAALGAAEVLLVRPDHHRAQAMLRNAIKVIGRPGDDPHWTWSETRLYYANAALPETLIAAGLTLGDHRALADGLAMLGWLLEVETNGDHLSVTPADGWARGEPRPGFDQQPIEVAAIADACARAFRLSGDERWRDGITRATDWFLGANDANVALYDPVSGGGCDGLERYGRNDNQGAESTLAMISTFQQARGMK